MGKHCLKLETPEDIRRALAKIANLAYKGEIDLRTANSFTVTCNVILSSIRIDEQEKKIAQLEKVLSDLG